MQYLESADGLTAAGLAPVCSEWRVRPDPGVLCRAVCGATHVLWARAGAEGPPVGLLTAVSDGVLSAHIALLEVLPGWRGQGIGTELLRRCLGRLVGCYAVDLVCDAELAAFYARLGMVRGTAMMLRQPAAMYDPSTTLDPESPL